MSLWSHHFSSVLIYDLCTALSASGPSLISPLLSLLLLFCSHSSKLSDSLQSSLMSFSGHRSASRSGPTPSSASLDSFLGTWGPPSLLSHLQLLDQSFMPLPLGTSSSLLCEDVSPTPVPNRELSCSRREVMEKSNKLEKMKTSRTEEEYTEHTISSETL